MDLNSKDNAASIVENSDSSTSLDVFSNGKKDKHVCQICKKGFTEKRNLVRHMQSHSKAKEFICETCQKKFSRHDALRRHLPIHKNNSEKFSFDCSECGKSFGRKDSMMKHQTTHLRTFSCRQCDQSLASKQNLTHHMKVVHPKQQPGVQSSAPKRQKVKRTSDVFSTKYILPNASACGDLNVFLRESNDSLSFMLQEELEIKRAIKWYIVIKIRFSRMNFEGDEDMIISYFRSMMEVELDSSMIQQHIEEAFSKIKLVFEEFIQHGSGWILDEILHMEVKMIMYHPLAPY